MHRDVLVRAVRAEGEVARAEDDGRFPFAGHDVGVARSGQAAEFRLAAERAAVGVFQGRHRLMVERQIDRVEDAVDDRVVDDAAGARAARYRSGDTPSMTDRIWAITSSPFSAGL